MKVRHKHQNILLEILDFLEHHPELRQFIFNPMVLGLTVGSILIIIYEVSHP